MVAVLLIVLALIAYTTLTSDDAGEQQASEPPQETTEQEPATTSEITEETTVEEATVEEATVEETTVEDASAEETTVEDASAEETAAEDDSAGGTTPEEVLALYYEYQNGQSYALAYDLLSSQSKQRVTSEQYVGFWQSQLPVTTFYSLSDAEVQGDTASVPVALTISSQGQEASDESVRTLVREDIWRLELNEDQIAQFTAAG